MNTLHARSIFAVENIQTQNDGFGERLEGFVTIMRDEIVAGTLSASDVGKSPVLKEIEKAVFKRFGLKVDLITNEVLAAVLPFYSNTSHIFITEYFRGNFNLRDQAKLLKTFDQRKGSVNSEKAVVTGIFSDYEHPLYINFYELIQAHAMTAAEVTAVMLHELGHAFSACQYADRTDRTNQVLAGIARHLNGGEPGDVDYVFRELSKVTPSVTKEAADKIVNGSRTVAGATWFKTIIGMVNSQTQDDTYNETAFEQQADAFASRFGYGKQLILGLDKLSAYTPEKSKALLILTQMVSGMTTLIIAAMVFASIATGGVLTAFVMSFYMGLLLTLHREDVTDYTYDKLKNRYLRMRQDIVDQLKDIKMNKTKVRELLDMLYAVDTCVKETSVVKTLPAYIANFIYSGARTAEKSITDQQLLEALASNDLFIHSAELRTA